MATKKKPTKPKRKYQTKRTSAVLNDPPISIRILGDQLELLRKASKEYNIPVGKLIRQITLKYLPVEYPVAA